MVVHGRGREQRGDERGDRGGDRPGDDYRRAAAVAEDGGEDEGPGLVETPEARLAASPSASMMPDLSRAVPEPAPAPREDAAPRKHAQRRPRKPKASAEGGEETAPASSEE